MCHDHFCGSDLKNNSLHFFKFISLHLSFVLISLKTSKSVALMIYLSITQIYNSELFEVVDKKVSRMYYFEPITLLNATQKSCSVN
jgi:hypothetical protein